METHGRADIARGRRPHSHMWPSHAYIHGQPSRAGGWKDQVRSEDPQLCPELWVTSGRGFYIYGPL